MRRLARRDNNEEGRGNGMSLDEFPGSYYYLYKEKKK